MERKMKIKVLICDDFPPILDLFRRFLIYEPSIEVVGMAGNGEQAVAQAMTMNPDVVLMDIQMPVLNGIEATRLITQAKKNTKVLMLSSDNEQATIVRCLDAGAAGYLPKSISPLDLIEAIKTAERGSSPTETLEVVGADALN